jgi:hypothetical protein
MGVVAAWLWGSADDPTQLVRDAVLAPARTAANSAPVIVGKITAMSKCQWLDPQTAARAGDPVAQGRSYVLTSGLLEIAYDAGARAIVEGPAIFTVVAGNGASLFLGKVTVHARKVDRAAVKNGENARHRMMPPPHAEAFCVRTHSAIIHDKGDENTEFGVEVDRSWVTYMRVFRGRVIIQSPGFEPGCVSAGTCVWTGAGGKHNGLFFFGAGAAPLMFATEMPKPLPVCAANPAVKEKQWRTDGGG